MSDDNESWKGDDDSGPPIDEIESELRELIRNQPFEPFTITMTSGRTYDVSNPFALAIGPVTFTVYYREGTARLRKSEVAHVDIPEPAA